MNRFTEIGSKTEFIDALIEHLQLLKESQYTLVRIEKDILLQDLRDAYLLLLSIQPLDETQEPLEKSSPIENMLGVTRTFVDTIKEKENFFNEVQEPLTDEEIEQIVEDFLEDLHFPEDEENEVPEMIQVEPETQNEEPEMPQKEVEPLNEEISNEEPLDEKPINEEMAHAEREILTEEMTNAEPPNVDAPNEEISNVEQEIEYEKVKTEKRNLFSEPLLFPIDDEFEPKGLFDDIEEQSSEPQNSTPDPIIREEEKSENQPDNQKDEEPELHEEEIPEEIVEEVVEEVVEEIVEEVVEEELTDDEILEKEILEEERKLKEVTFTHKGEVSGAQKEDVISKLTAESDISELIRYPSKEQDVAQKESAPQTPPMKRSLNDILNEKREENSLNNRFQNAKVTDLTKSISINDKFLFIKELFNNRGDEFSRAVQTLNSCTTMEEAFDQMAQLKKQHFWDVDSQAYLSFCDLVRRKF